MHGRRAVVFLLGACLAAFAQGAEKYQYPTWRIPRVDKPPVIDGTIHDDEYRSFAALSGMVTYGGSGGQGVVARMQDVTWYVGYDDRFLYLSMHSPHPKGTWPTASVKEMDSAEILWDDHTEIQIATGGRKNYAKPGVGFYKIMHNAKGLWRDEWLYNGTAGTEHLWSIGGDCKSTVTEDRWDMEMAVSLAALKEKNLDGRSWVMQLLRADAPGGVYFAGWVGEAWMSWDRFGEVVFDPEAPAFRFLDRGETAKGDLALRFELVGRGKAARDVTISAKALAADGRVLHEDSRTATVAPGQVVPVEFKGETAWPDGPGNRLVIDASAAGAGGTEPDRLFYTQIPVINLANPTEWKARVEPWLARKPKTGGFAWSFAYWPYYGIGEATVDLDFFGMPSATLAARSFRVDILPAGAAKPIGSQTGAISNLAGNLLLKTGELKDGDYTARVQLLDAAGKPVDEPKERPFRRGHYEWEHNRLGLDDVRIPPWPPLGCDTNRGALVLSPWNREITIGDAGLPARVRAGGGAGMEDILTGPIRLEAEAGGTVAAPAACELKRGEASDARVRLESSARLGPATLRGCHTMEFDGWYETWLELQGDAPDARLDRLTLVIPLWRGADTMWAQRGGDSIAGVNRLGEIPAGTGVVWESSALLPARSRWDFKDWQTFVPVVHGGSYDKGVWWFGDENEDWTSSDARPTVQYVRTAAGVEIRIHLLAAPARLDKVRRFHFALLVDPVKPVPDERAEGWGWKGRYNAGRYAQSTFGWREWGRSDDGYYMEEEDRTALREMLQGLRPPGRALGNGSLQQAGASGDRIVLYGSTSNMGEDLPAFDTFSGEWQGVSKIPSDERAPKSTGFNIGGSYESWLVREQHEIGCNWAQSQVDCFLWYHEKLLRECPVNGTWWDNGSLFVTKDFDPERGEFRYRWSMFMRRQLSKRLNVVGWRLNRRPWWVSNVHVDWSFNQVGWHIENDFYVSGPGNTLLDQMSMDQFRAYAGLRRGLIHRLTSRYEGQEPSTLDEIRLRARSTIGLCLLHDIGAYLWSDEYRQEYTALPELLHEEVGFFNEAAACSFIGYWRSGDLVRVNEPGVYVSVYRGNNRAALVVMNGDRRAKEVGFELLPALLGRAPQRMIDAETRRPIERLWDTSVTPHVQRFGEYRPGAFRIEGHGLRLFVVE